MGLGMPIPRRFSFLGNRGLHFFIPRGSGNLEPIPRGPRGIFGELNPLKSAILSNEYDTAGLNFIKSNDQNSKLKSEVQNSYRFENELNKLVSSLDEFLR